MKENEVIERIGDFKKFADLVGSPGEFFQHMQGHTKELSLILCVFDVAENVDVIIKALEEKQQNRWIPVSERMPEEHEHYGDSELVLVTVKDYEKDTTFVHDDNTVNGEWAYFRGACYEVIAWRPLPEPYKESDAE